MAIEQELKQRADSKCELCSSSDQLSSYEIPPESNGLVEQCILTCQTCQKQIDGSEEMESNHWRCLNDSMWSPTPAVQIMAWRLLNRLSHEDWSQNLLEMLYLDEENLNWAKAAGDGIDNDDSIKHIDSNGAQLLAGDNVTLIKDLPVKGANFTAKRGTTVRGISLSENNSEHIEGRVNGQKIVILTRFVKKSN